MHIAVLVVGILVGLLVVAPRLMKGNEDAQKVLDQIRTYQKWIGAAVGIFAVIAFIVIYIAKGGFWIALFHVGLLGSIVCLTLLGFLMAYSLIAELGLDKNEAAKAKAEAFRAKWDPKQTTLGILALVLSIAALIARSALGSWYY